MSFVKVTQQFEALQNEFRKDIKETFGTFETKLDVATADHFYSTRNCRDERELLEQTIETTKIHLARLKTRINMLVPINRLPVELLIHIILLAYSPKQPRAHPYLPYSWVCAHWRSVLIQTPDFWTFIRYGLQFMPSLPTTPFDYELLQRAKSAQLDVNVKIHSRSFAATFEQFLAKESHRIRNLWIIAYEEYGPIFSGKPFPSLRGLNSDQWEYTRSLPDLLPTLVVCDHLVTFQCTLWWRIIPDVVHSLATIFSRIRRLNIRLCQELILPIVFDMLHDNGNLQDFEIVIEDQDYSSTNLSGQINLPGLQFLSIDNTLLLHHLRIPRLSGLVTHSYSSPALQIIQRVLKNFDLSSIRYLYILDPHHEQNMSRSYSILGSKERRHFESLFSTEVEYFVHERLSANAPDPVNHFCREVFSIDDIISDICPRNCFEFKFDDEHFKLFAAVMKQVVSSTLPRLTHLTELYIFSSILVSTKGIKLERFLKRLPPSIEKIIMKSVGDDLTDLFRLLSNPSLCPRLKHLSSKGSCDIPQGLDSYAEDIGRSLTECLQSRHKVHGDRLQHIALGDCPPLPDAWLKEIQKLGTKVVTMTMKDARNIMIMNS